MKKFELDYRKEIEAVITIPNNFTNIHIINEPTFSTLFYGMNEKVEEDHILFFDFGGGTLNISILRFLEESIIVQSSVGNQRLGGNDLGNVLLNYCIDYLKKTKNFNLENESKLFYETRLECKIQLSDFQYSEIKIKLPNETIDIPISREEFEELCEKKNYWKKIENL